jgi:hypothetical protein
MLLSPRERRRLLEPALRRSSTHGVAKHSQKAARILPRNAN